MPYTAQHKQRTRSQIVEAARVLFNRHGFENVTIDQVMQQAGLTRGGFYNHFKNKESLYSEAVESFLMGRGAQWRADAGVDASTPSIEMAHQMISSYLSTEHLGDLDGQCPMIALPSDVARGGDNVKASYQRLLEAMVALLESAMSKDRNARDTACTLAALCVGGMVLARTLPDSALADAVRSAAHSTAHSIISGNQ